MKHSPQLNITYLPIGALKAHPNNPRTHSPQQIRLIRQSLREFGFTNPLLIDANNTVFAGNGRLEAARLDGLETVPAVRLEHLTKDQLRAYLVADNRIAEKAGWDEEILRIELQHLLTLEDFDVTVTGFAVPEIDLLFADKDESATGKPDPDDRLPDAGPAITRRGDLWRLGRHRVLCADSLSPDSYPAVMGSAQAELVLADPPFNVRIAGHVGGLGQIQHREFAMAAGEMSEEQFTDFLRQAFRLCARHSASGSLHYFFIDWRHVLEMLTAGRAVYSELKNICVWEKDTPGMGSFYRSQHELVAIFRHGKVKSRNNINLGAHGRNRSNVWKYPGVNAFGRMTDEGRLAESHPTIKPVALLADAILDCTARGDVVLDPFLGSGSTLIAAERVGRICHGIELDPAYVDVAIRRWQKHTGDVAVHAATGTRFDDVAEEVRHG